MRFLLLMLVAFTLPSASCTFGQSKADLAMEAVNRGLAAHGAGRLDEAAATYHEALGLDPLNPLAYFNLGVIDQGAGRPQAAERNYRLVLSLNPDFPSALFNLAIIRNNAGNTQEAIELYRRVIAVQPDNASAHLNLGVALRSIGQQADGDADVSRAGELNPQFRAPTP